MNYDIIGDVHGHAEALKALLGELGYRDRSGAWRHPDRSAIFVGDFIDRGPRQVEAVSIVRRMVDGGSALAVMGNHEFNAIAWFLPDPDHPGEYLRRHSDKNFRQHQAFLAEVIGTPRHKELIEWFLGLPLWLDLPELGVVHACWHPSYMAYLAPHLTKDRQLSDKLMGPASREPRNEEEKDTPEPTIFKAVEVLLKGVEIPLPEAHTFKDKDGHERKRVRVRWWDPHASTCRRAAMVPEEIRQTLPDDPIPEHVRLGNDAGKPLFIGHYWLSGKPELRSRTVACVDYSIGKGGKLVAYRWDGEPVLDAERFRCISAGA